MKKITPKIESKKNCHLKGGFILAILAIIFFHQIITHSGFFFGDFANYELPKLSFNCSQIAQGKMPTWCSYHDLGRPIGQMAWHSAFYPLYLILAPCANNLSAFEYLFSLAYVFQVFWAALGTFYLLRYWKISLQNAIIGSLSVAFCSSMVITITSANNGAGYGWIPWILYGLLRIYEDLDCFNWRTFRKTILTGGAVGCCFLVSIVHRDVHIALFVAAFGFLLVGQLIFKKEWLKLGRFVVFAALAAILGFMISSVSILPSLEYYSLAGRGTVDIYKDTNDQVPWRLFLTNLIPNIFGRVQGPGSNGTWLTRNFLVEWFQGPFNPKTWAIFWGGNQPLAEHWNFWCRVNYSGLLPILSLLVVPWLILKKNVYVIFFAIVAIFMILYIYGLNNPLQYAVAEIIPIFKSFRIPVRYAFFISLPLAIITAFALERIWPKTKTKLKWPFWTFAATTIIIMIVAGLIGLSFLPKEIMATNRGNILGQLIDLIPKHSLYFQLMLLLAVLITYALAARQKITFDLSKWILVAIVFIDLFMFAGHINNASNPASNAPNYPFTQKLAEISTNNGPNGRFRFESNLAQANLNSVHWGLDSYNGYIMARPSYDNEMAKMRAKNKALYYDLWNVKYSLFPIRSNQELQSNISSIPKWALPYAQQGLVIKERPRALKRAWFVSQAVAKDDLEALEFMQSKDFDPKNTVILPSHTLIETPLASTNATVKIISYDHTKIELESAGDQPGYVVLSELYYPGWKATIDGKPTEILRANLAMRAIATPAGKHKLILTYSPNSFKIGFILYLTGFLIVLIAIFIKGKNK